MTESTQQNQEPAPDALLGAVSPEPAVVDGAAAATALAGTNEPPAPEVVELAPSLLETELAAMDAADKAKADAKPADKVADPAKVEGATEPPKDGQQPTEPQAPSPVAYEYKLPETLKMDDGLKAKFHTALDAFRTDPVKNTQALIDLHNERMQEFASEVPRNQIKAFNETRKKWNADIMADPYLGGSGYGTTVKQIAQMRSLLVSPKDQQPFEDMLRQTGVGDHPMFWKMLKNAHRIFGEPQSPAAIGNPTPNNGAAPGRRRLSEIYNKPTG